MARLSSIFGDLVTSQNLQVIVDKSLDLFNVPSWKKYFTWGVPTIGLTYKAVIGAARMEAMASMIDRGSAKPIRSRAGLAAVEGAIPAIGEKFQMREEMYRDYLTMQSLPMNDVDKRNAILDMIFNDLRIAGNAPHMRLDYIAYQMLSTAKMQITVANNPDGIISDEVDLLMPLANKYKTVGDIWATTATSTPIIDIQHVVNDFRLKGVVFDRMLMDYFAFNNLAASETLAKYLYGKVTTNVKYIVSLALVNDYLQGVGLPTIEIVNSVGGVESDGAISSVVPWAEGQVTFIPAGPVGTMYNAFSIESLKPVPGVSYAVYEKVLLSKWSVNDPWAEFTQCELNAFPGWENIDRCAILDTKTKA
jgi:hypothetical protein